LSDAFGVGVEVAVDDGLEVIVDLAVVDDVEVASSTPA
jgi:hypothetical protein